MFQVGEDILREDVAIPGVEAVGFGEAAEGAAAEGEVDLPLFSAPIRVVEGDFAEAPGDIHQMAADDVAEQGIQIDEVSSERGRGHPQGRGHGAEADGVAAVARQERLCGVEDVFALLAITFGGEALLAIEFIGLGAEDAGVCLHAADVSQGDEYCQY